MRRLGIILLALALAIPMVGVTQARTENYVYAGGGSGYRASWHPQVVVQEPIRAGPIEIDLTGPNGEPGHFETANIVADDLVQEDVKVYWTFHRNPDVDETVLGGTTRNVGSGVFCSEATLPIPQDAVKLRLTVNAPITAYWFQCQPGTATVGYLNTTLS